MGLQVQLSEITQPGRGLSYVSIIGNSWAQGELGLMGRSINGNRVTNSFTVSTHMFWGTAKISNNVTLR